MSDEYPDEEYAEDDDEHPDENVERDPDEYPGPGQDTYPDEDEYPDEPAKALDGVPYPNGLAKTWLVTGAGINFALLGGVTTGGNTSAGAY